MALVSQSIPNLVGGISQQPPVLRRSSQCEDSLNTYLDPVTGCKKRSGSVTVSSLTLDTELGDWFSIERDAVEKYIFKVSSTGIEVWDSLGVKRSVDYPNGTAYLSSGGTFKIQTIADTTFITNTTVPVQQSSTSTPTNEGEGLIFIRAVDYEVEYKFNIDGAGLNAVSYTTPASGQISVATVAENLANQLNAQQAGVASSRGGVLRFDVGSPYSLAASASLGDDYLTAIPGEIRNFGDLPAVGFDGTIVRVTGDPGTNVDDYYVKFVGDGVGSWIETVGPGVSTGLDRSTMPHVLVSNADGTFTFKEFEWDERIAGDEETNANPSFVGETITNILFFRNRLGFLSDTNVILSESANVNNFFKASASTVIDSDPIDLQVSGQQVDVLYTAVPVVDGLLLFSENGQFLLNVGDADILSPETASIVSLSDYQSKVTVDPKRVGDTILFVTDRDNQSGVREYFYAQGRTSTSSADITKHVPFLLPSSISYISANSTESIAVFLDKNNTILYVYQYLWDGDKKAMSAWSKWEFNAGETVFTEIFEDSLFLVIKRSNDYFLESVPVSNSFVQEPLSDELCLDQLIKSDTAVSTILTGSSTVINFGQTYSSAAGEPVLISLSDVPELEIFVGDRIPVVSYSNDIGNNQSSVTIDGDWSQAGREFFLGFPYNFFYDFSTPYLTTENDSDIDNRTQVRSYTIQLTRTGNCSFQVFYNIKPDVRTVGFVEDIDDWSLIQDMQVLTLSEGESYTYQLSRDFPELDLDNRYNSINHPYRVLIMSENIQSKLRVFSNSWQPVRMSKASVEFMFYKRNRPV